MSEHKVRKTVKLKRLCGHRYTYLMIEHGSRTDSELHRLRTTVCDDCEKKKGRYTILHSLHGMLVSPIRVLPDGTPDPSYTDELIGSDADEVINGFDVDDLDFEELD